MHDVLIVGAGFGGLALAHALQRDGNDDYLILERSDGVGGTWRHNTYPGAACDVPSHLYSLSFAPNPDWSRAYAGQAEILAYAEACYDRLDVRRHVRCNAEVVEAVWDEHELRWSVRTRDGVLRSARVLVSAIGTFHTPVTPALPGLDSFAGTIVHSATWNHAHDLTGREVAVIGTGASAIQIVPAIAATVGSLAVYQRTPAWIVPRVDPPYSTEQRQAFADDPELARAHRKQMHDALEKVTIFTKGDPTAALIEKISRDLLAGAVADPALRAQLTPTYPIGCKRILVSSDFYPALQRENVALVTDAIDTITPAGIRTADGTERPADTIVMATGFRATDYLHGISVRGRSGRDLHETWAGTPRAFHGIAVPGFPNLFLMYGPNTNQGGNSILLMLEAQATFIAGALASMRRRGVPAVDVRPRALARYVEELTASLAETVWHDGCDSYFRNAAGEVVTQLPHTTGWYRDQTATFPDADFEALSP